MLQEVGRVDDMVIKVPEDDVSMWNTHACVMCTYAHLHVHASEGEQRPRSTQLELKRGL